MKIKTGDNVKILSGKERGKTGEVMQVLTSKKNGQTYVVVKGLNIRKKHLRSGRSGETGQVIELPGPIHISNVQALDTNNKPTRVGYTTEGETKKRVAKKTGENLD